MRGLITEIRQHQQPFRASKETRTILYLIISASQYVGATTREGQLLLDREIVAAPKEICVTYLSAVTSDSASFWQAPRLMHRPLLTEMSCAQLTLLFLR